MRASTLLIALALTGCARSSDLVATAPTTPGTPGTSTGSTTSTTTSSTTTGTTATTTPGPTSTWGVADPPTLGQGTLDQIGADIDVILANASSTHGVYILDLENGQEIYGNNADLALKPASNTKLYTTGAAMDLLGPDHRFETSAWSPALPDASGNLGDLDIVVGHDFTWSNYFYADEYFAADRLAEQLYDAGVRSVNGTLTVHGEVVVDGYQFSTYDEWWHRDQAVTVVQSALSLAGISVNDSSMAAAGFSPGGILLTSRLSPPLATANHPLNVYSHNEFADILAHHNGYELWGGDSSYAGGEAAVLDWIDGLGLNSTPLNFQDGSGLSHDNRVTARLTAQMLQAMDGRPAGRAWVRTFSIGGVIGTLYSRLTGSDTYGRFWGKTGTLTGVIATSGILHNRYDGHRYAISILMNDTAWDNTTIRNYQNQIVEVMADDLRGLGSRPDAPVVQTVRSNADGTVSLEWDPAANADTYVVWVSTDGVWRRSEARETTGTSITLVSLTPDRNHEFRVTAENAAGLSDPSDSYTSRTASEPSRILIVDGNDRYDTDWQNPMGHGHDFGTTTGLALGPRAHDTAANEAVTAGLVQLTDYDAVLWVLGEESTTDLTFDDDERTLVDAYLAQGGNLLVSGAEIGWDLDYLGTADMVAFYESALHASYVGDDAGTWTVLPSSGGIFDGVGELGFYVPQTLEVNYPDVIAPVGGAVTELEYWGGTGGTAAISYSGAYKVVHLGFPFEAIDNAPQREAAMDGILGFFGIP